MLLFGIDVSLSLPSSLKAVKKVSSDEYKKFFEKS